MQGDREVFDSVTALVAAKADPVGFIHGLRKPVVIDEIQRVPEVFLPIKEDVDKHRLPGRYLLTGSANALTLPTIADSLAGRMEVLTLHLVSQREIAGIRDDFIARVEPVAGANTDTMGGTTREDLTGAPCPAFFPCWRPGAESSTTPPASAEPSG